MKTSKKIWLGISALLYMFILVSVVFPAHRALAAGAANSKQDIIDCGNSLKFVNIAEMTCVFGGTTAQFTDSNPSDSGTGGSKSYFEVNYAPDSSFCPGIDGLPGNGGSYHLGVTRTGSTNNFNVTDAGKTISVKLNVGYSDAATGVCKPYSKDFSIPPARTKGIATLMEFATDGTSIDSFDSVTGGDLNGKQFDLVGKYTYNKTTYAFQQGFTPGTCSGEIVMFDKSISGAHYFSLNKDNQSLAKYPGLLDFLNKQQTSGCYIHESKTDFGLGGAFAVAGTPPTPGTVNQTQTLQATAGSSALNSPSGCEANAAGFPLSWALCPVLDAASSLSGALIGLFEDQLSFKVADLGVPTNPKSGSSEVRASWALVRDISSSLLVVIMLVMVLSQAVSWGPFDAYTIKKLMPKMVLAVILMQISWDLFSYVVGVFDDIGHGLANVIYLPFGGVSNMTLQHLLGNAGLKGAGGNAALGSLDWAAIGVGLFLGYAYVFTMLGMGIVAIVSLLAGLFTLVFRKILIIMLLILSPLALVAWILPGTATYWKMWRENFIKALSMFPIAMGIIAAGRIFAQVAGTQDNGTFIALLFVLVGFFGPLFILPKTFKWGGQAMQMAGNGIMKTGSKISERPKKFMDKRQEGWSHYLAEKSQERVAKGEGFSWKKPWVYPVDQLKSGKWDPTYGLKGSDRRMRAVQSYVEQGEKSEQEAVNAAEARLIRERQKLRAQGGNHDLMLQAIADGLEEYNDPTLGKVHLGKRNQAERMAARKQLAKLGAGMNWRYLENYYESTRKHAEAHPDDRHAQEEAAEMRKFFDDNVETILPKLPHIYKSVAQAADADPAGIANMHGVEVEAILANLSETIKDPTNGGTKMIRDEATGEMRAMNARDVANARAGAQTSMTTFLQNFQRAVENSQRGGPQLENGALRAVKGFLDPNAVVADDLLGKINNEKVHGRAGKDREAALPGDPPRELPLLGRVDELAGHIDADHAELVDGLRSSLAGMINEDGYVQRGAGAEAPAAQVTSPGEIKIQHRQAAASVLPPPTLLTPGSAAWQAFKLQLKTDPSAVEILANNIAHGTSAPEYHQVLEDMRNDAVTAATPEAAQEYNTMVSKIQQALQQRVNQTATVAAARGHDATGARAAGANRIVDLEAGGGATYRKV